MAPLEVGIGGTVEARALPGAAVGLPGEVSLDGGDPLRPQLLLQVRGARVDLWLEDEEQHESRAQHLRENAVEVHRFEEQIVGVAVDEDGPDDDQHDDHQDDRHQVLGTPTMS